VNGSASAAGINGSAAAVNGSAAVHGVGVNGSEGPPSRAANGAARHGAPTGAVDVDVAVFSDAEAASLSGAADTEAVVDAAFSPSTNSVGARGDAPLGPGSPGSVDGRGDAPLGPGSPGSVYGRGDAPLSPGSAGTEAQETQQAAPLRSQPAAAQASGAAARRGADAGAGQAASLRSERAAWLGAAAGTGPAAAGRQVVRSRLARGPGGTSRTKREWLNGRLVDVAVEAEQGHGGGG
jgi:hypothetical protein